MKFDAETKNLDAEILEFIRGHAARDADDAEFGALALKIFDYQFKRNVLYRRFCLLEGKRPSAVKDWREIPAMPSAGFKELVLTGVNIGTYEQESRTLLDVVDALNDLGLPRVRISSIEPTTVDDRLLERMADPQHNLVPYLHLPLQSASDKVLSWMNRHYTAADYSAFIHKVKRRVPGVMIGTDILAGVPAEREEDFLDTLHFLRDQPLDYAHAFTYSEREGTPAAREVQVPPDVRKERTLRIMSQSLAKRAEFAGPWLGREVELLVEEHAEGYWQGRTDNFMLVKFQASGDMQNQFVRVRVAEVCGEWVRGELCD